MSINQSKLLEIIESHRIHPTAEDILQLARAENPKISLGTVYRNLNKLVLEGKIRRLNFAGEPDHFDTIEPHDHLKCTNCGAIIDIDKISCQAGNLPAGCVVQSFEATAFGLCAACSRENADA